MLAVPAKGSAESLDLNGSIKKYITSEFGRGSAEDGSSSLQKAQKLRDSVAQMAGGAEEVKQALLGYYRFLTALEVALPVGKERSGVPLTFKWTDAFQPDRGDVRSDIVFEKASLLFNLGAISSQVALGADLGSEKGVRAAAKCYQEAAGVFAYIAEHLVPRLQTPYPTDLSPESCGMLSSLCLAQAQECFYSKAAGDRKSPALLARIACQVAEQYREVNHIQLSDQLKRELGKPFIAHLSIKASLYRGLTLVHQSEVFIADDECGEQITCLKEAERLLGAARKEGTGWVRVDSELISKIDSALDTIRVALVKADRENNSLYFQREPPIEDVASPAPASLVSLIAPPEDIEKVDPSWFGFLDDSNRQRLSGSGPSGAYMGNSDDMAPRTPSPVASGGSAGSVGSALGRFAFGAAKGVAGWAVNQALDSVNSNDRAKAAAAADSRNVAQMYDAPRELSVSELFASDSSSGNSRNGSLKRGNDEPRIDSHKYVEEVRLLIEKAMDTISAANSTRDQALQRMGLPEALKALAGDLGSSGLKDDTLKQIEGYRRKGGVQHLVQMLRDISQVREDCLDQLDRIEAQLEAEEKEDEAARAHYGSEWPMQVATTLTANLRDRLAGYRDNLRDAGKSDGKLTALVDDNAAKFAALGLGTLPGRSAGRKGDWTKSKNDGSAIDVVAQVRSDLAEIDHLARERVRLHDAFKKLWNSDVIIQKQGKYPEWELDQGFNKFEDAAEALDRNSSRQQQVLDQLEQDMRQFGEQVKEEHSSAQDSAAVVKKFGNVEKSLGGGQKFYLDLLGYIQALDKETEDYLAQRYAEGKDAVSLMERSNTPSEWAATPSRKSDGGVWPFGGGSNTSSKKSRWSAIPERFDTLGYGRFNVYQPVMRRRQMFSSVTRSRNPNLLSSASSRVAAAMF